MSSMSGCILVPKKVDSGPCADPLIAATFHCYKIVRCCTAEIRRAHVVVMLFFMNLSTFVYGEVSSVLFPLS